MTTTEKLRKFAQSVYLTRYNRYIDDITDSDGVDEINKAIDWTNMFLDELMTEVDPEGRPIDWYFLRQNDVEIGVISNANQTFDLPDGVLRIVIDEFRPLVISQDGASVSEWDVVAPSQLTNRNRYLSSENRVSFVGDQIVFSRPLNDGEIGGTITADVINEPTEMTLTNVDILDTVKPKSLLILGVAKNATLPDIVQGGTSPAFAQKYNNLLEGAKARSQASSIPSDASREDFGNIAGIY
jgi:hypothetical protein